MRLRIAHDAALAHVLAPSLKLRLYQYYRFFQRFGCSHNRRQHQRGRDKRHVHYQKRELWAAVNWFSERPWLKQPCIGPLHQPYPWVGAQLGRDLAKARVDVRYMRRPLLQQAVGESPG